MMGFPNAPPHFNQTTYRGGGLIYNPQAVQNKKGGELQKKIAK